MIAMKFNTPRGTPYARLCTLWKRIRCHSGTLVMSSPNSSETCM